MTFASPLWLVGLLPWAAVTVWLLWGRRKRVDVPFLELWKGPVADRSARRAVQLPPAGLAAAIAAMLLAVIAAGGPRLDVRMPGGGPVVSVVVDRGATMSGRDQYAKRLRIARDAIMSAFGLCPVDLVLVPDGQLERTDTSDWFGVAVARPVTAVNTQRELESIVRRMLYQTAGPVVVVSDRLVSMDDPRLVRIAPATLPSNVGIVAIAAREKPAAQVMVRLRNQSDQEQAELLVYSDGHSVGRIAIDLPQRNREQDYFVNVAALGKAVSAEVVVKDDLPVDNRAWLVYRRTLPAIEAQSPLPAGLARVVAKYVGLNPPDRQSQRVLITRGTEEALVGQAAVILSEGASVAPSGPNDDAMVREHPITAAIDDWTALTRTNTAGGAPDEPGWANLVTIGGRAVLAVRESPARQVWVGFDAESAAATPQFVIFWTNVLDWVGQVGQMFVASPVRRLSDEWKRIESTATPEGLEAGWWPGLYQRGEELVAVNAVDLRLAPGHGDDGLLKMGGLAADLQSQWRGVPLTPWLLVLSLVCMAVAALAWRREVRPMGMRSTDHP